MKTLGVIVGEVILVAILVGAFVYFQKPTQINSEGNREENNGDPIFQIIQSEGFYEGEPTVGNEILVTAVIEIGDEQFNNWDWNNFDYYSRNCEGTPSGIECKNMDDVFQIEYDRREVTRNGNKVTIIVPVNILKEGKGNINFEYTLSGEGIPPHVFTPAVYVETN